MKWEAEYPTAFADWATCAFAREIGNGSVHPEVQPILKIHDETTKAETKLPFVA